jgi:transglutaminase-like putative cysteine protease
VRRTAALGLLAALVTAWSWLRLEHGELTWSLLLWSIGVGILPALLPSTRLRLAAVPVAALLGLHHALGTAWPREAWDRIVDGFYLYYDVPLPFGAAGHPLMHGTVVLAVLGFTLAISLAVAERRALLATGLLVAGASWPATLLTSSNTVSRGAVILGAALVLLGGLSSAVRLRQGSIAAAVVVVAAVLVSGVPAVAKGAFLGWQTWEPSGKNDLPISVSYVWDSDYGALEWPERKTTVLTIEAPPISRYWRATTLDVFNGDYWLESTLEVQPDPLFDPLLPLAGRNEQQQLRARVKVEALEDNRLIGASVPVRYELDDEDEFVLYQSTGTAYIPKGVPRGSTYTSWSYAARPAPRALARSAPIYSAALDRYLVVQSRTATPPSPRFGSPGRREAMERIFAENPGLNSYRPLYERALAIAGDAPSPYAAVVELETSFRDGQSYVYDQNPTAKGDIPPLVEFVTRTHRGYCQHFAGAMALMLRYLGIPARVGAGFTSGSYDQEKGRWKVTDHDAHTWVEVWFRGYGWLPFDPTPGRGDLDGAYSAASVGFNAAAVSAAIAAGLDAADYKLNTERFDRGGSAGRGAGRDVPGDVAGTTSGGSEDSLLRLLALAALALVAGIGLLKLALRRVRFLTRDPRKVAAACRRELGEFLADQRIAVPESATPAELGEVIRHEVALEVGPFVDAVTAARYAPPERADEAARRARRELRRIERALRGQLSIWERFRGLVSVRSLGLT